LIVADLYALLGIHDTASPEEIERTYRQQVFLHSLDQSGHALQHLTVIAEAYAVLSHPQRKADYDHVRRNVTAKPSRRLEREVLNRVLDDLLEEAAFGGLK